MASRKASIGLWTVCKGSIDILDIICRRQMSLGSTTGVRFMKVEIGGDQKAYLSHALGRISTHSIPCDAKYTGEAYDVIAGQWQVQALPARLHIFTVSSIPPETNLRLSNGWKSCISERQACVVSLTQLDMQKYNVAVVGIRVEQELQKWAGPIEIRTLSPIYQAQDFVCVAIFPCDDHHAHLGAPVPQSNGPVLEDDSDYNKRSSDMQIRHLIRTTSLLLVNVSWTKSTWEISSIHNNALPLYLCSLTVSKLRMHLEVALSALAGWEKVQLKTSLVK